MNWQQIVKPLYRAICLAPLLLIGFSTPSRAQTELFFSEYSEGSSNNKALEIYNGTGAAVNLATGSYNVQMFFNGSGTAGLTINLAGTVANGDVFVLAHASANATILAQADQTNGAGWYNGDDAVVLRKGTTIIDVIGQVGFDPGTEWGAGLTSTADNTLQRKAPILAGDVNSLDVFDPSLEWNGFAQDTFTGLGLHMTIVNVVINELEADTPSTDNLEFVELFDGGAGNTALDGLVVVFYNGATDVSYAAFDLDGFTTDANGFFVLGNTAVANVDLAFSNNTLQNGEDAVALYTGNAADFPNGTAVTTTNLLDAIVYDTDDPDDAGLLVLLNAGQPQVNENGGGDQVNHSSQRIPNGSGGQRNTSTYEQHPPTPGAVNVGVTPPTFVIINEIDADTPGADVLEFVELYDGGVGNTALDGLVVVFYNGATDLSYAAFDLDGFSTDANGYFLFGNSGVTPPPSFTFGNGTLQNGEDAVALYTGNVADFPGGSAVTTANLLDAIVYGTDDPDDPGLLVLLNAGQPQVNENGGGDGANHSNQRIPNGSGGARNTNTYVQLLPTPGAENAIPPPPLLEIFEIQSAGLASPYATQTVITENNIVTAVAANGFAMQTPEARVDADVETSNGIFVFTGAAPGVAVGDIVNVTGQVVEFFNFTEFTNSPTVTVLSSGNPLPAPVLLDALSPSPDQPQPATELERYEGMLIQINGGAVTGPNQTFGSDPIAEVFITAAPDRTFREPGIAFPGLPALPVWDGNPEVFELDPDRLGLPNQIVPAGSSFDAVGVLGFEFSGYEFWPKQFSFTPATLPRAVRPRNADEATIGTLNLFRLFDNIDDPGSQDNGDIVSAAEYARRLAKFSLYIRNVLGAPDILAVQEAEKIEVLQALAAKIAADDPSVVYTSYLSEGNDVGGIDTGFLVRNTVQVDAVTQLGAAEIFTFDGSLLHDRPPLLLEGRFINGSFLSPITVMAVHNRSLTGIDDPVDGPRVRQKRLEQAQSIAQKVQDLQTANPNIRLVVTGDFNAYQFTDGYVDAVGQIAGDFNPSDNLLSGPDLVNPNLTNQVLSLPAAERYSFIFDGSAQVLDHILTSQAVKPVEVQYGRGNADAAENFINDDTTPLRASDHDGLVMYLDVVPPTITIAGSPAELWSPNHQYETFSLSDFVAAVADGGTPGLSLADVYIVSASSDEPDNAPGGGDGNTTDDIVIVDCQTVQLRAERQGSGNGRVYTVTVAAEDASGNVGTATFQVHVPKNQSGDSAIDDGPASVVTSGCSAPNAPVKTLAGSPADGEVAAPAEAPADFALAQNYPNPFNPETEIRFQLPQAGQVVIKIFNTLGREIVTLVDQHFEAGYHRIHWDGRDQHGNALASGVYLYQLRAGHFSQVRKMSLLR